MIFTKDRLIKIENIIKEPELYAAHTGQEEGELEGLSSHLDLTFEYCVKLAQENDLERVFSNIYSELFQTEIFKGLFKEMVVNTVYLHDIGKINPRFQRDKMGQKNMEVDPIIQDSKHSPYSAWIFLKIYLEKLDQIIDDFEDGIVEIEYSLWEKELSLISRIMLLNTRIIYGHHSKIKSSKDIRESLQGNDFIFKNYSCFADQFVNIPDSDIIDFLTGDYYISELTENRRINQIIYIYGRLLYGLLTHSDILATMEYTEKIKTREFGSLDEATKRRLNEIYEKNDITQTIRNYERGNHIYSPNDINGIRSEMFLEAEQALDEKYNIFQLEAPTGGGKTNIAINLTLKLLNENNGLKNVFYAFPFNTLVEQTYQSLEEIFSGDPDIMENISIYNSVNSFENLQDSIDKIKEQDNEELDETKVYSILYRDYQFLYSPIVVSTNVKLFDIFFGNSKSSFYPIPLMTNSIVILDEIQSYKNSIWFEMIEMLNTYAKILNCKFIVMSATLPDINKILEISGSEDVVQSLIKDPTRYYQDKRFKERVILDFSLLQLGEDSENKQEIIFEAILDRIKEECNGHRNILIEFIKKKTAYQFRRYLEEKKCFDELEFEILTGDTGRKKRKRIIQKVKRRMKNPEKISSDYILIATQTIEAGVDIDMDIGFKDISLLDSEEQFLGRINRNFKKEDAVAYFFNLDIPEKIYRNDVRTEKDFTLNNLDMQSLLRDKNFSEYYQKYIIPELNLRNQSRSSADDHKNYIEGLRDTDYYKISKFFRLIDQSSKHSIFLNHDSKDTNKIEGSELWKKYLEIIYDRNDFSKKKIRLMNIRSEMDSYLFEIYQKPSDYQDYAGSIYYFEDGQPYFEGEEFYSELMSDNKSSFDFL